MKGNNGELKMLWIVPIYTEMENLKCFEIQKFP